MEEYATIRVRLLGDWVRLKVHLFATGLPLILGMDWLDEHNPDIDWRSGSITTRSTVMLAKSVAIEMSDKASLCFISTTKPAQQTASSPPEWLEEYADMFFTEAPTNLPPRRGDFDFRVELEHGTTPPNLKPYSASALERDVIDKIISELLDKEVIRPSTSPYAAPCLLVKKADGSWRLVIDYRALKKNTISMQFPLPDHQDLIDAVTGATSFGLLMTISRRLLSAHAPATMSGS